jgi:hypothetical protein
MYICKPSYMEGAGRRIMVWNQPVQDPILKNSYNKSGWRRGSSTGAPPSMCETLNSNPSIAKRKMSFRIDIVIFNLMQAFKSLCK